VKEIKGRGYVGKEGREKEREGRNGKEERKGSECPSIMNTNRQIAPPAA
jgi:hypothetical protein